METIIAFVILAMGISFAGIAIGMSLRNMNNARNRIIAVNVAREGIEAVRNIRDTNWLKFNSKRRACWNHFPPKNPTDGCAGSTPIEPGRYLVYRQGEYAGGSGNTYRWRLNPLKKASDAIADPYIGSFDNDSIPDATNNLKKYYHNSDTNNTYHSDGLVWEDVRQLHIVDSDATIDTDNDLDATNDNDFYNHAYPSDTDPLGTSMKTSPLYREVIIEYLNNDGTALSSGNTTDAHNRMRITSKVTWLIGGREFNVELMTHLTDYLGREDLSG